MARILIAGFCAVPGPDRAGVQMCHVIRALERSHNLDVLVQRRPEQAYVERMAGGRILRVPMPEGGLREQIEAFRRALRRQLEGAEYDVVHFRDAWAGIPALELRERLGYAAVFDVARSPMAQPQILDLETSAEQARAEEACLLGADLILAPTEPARRFLAARTRPERVHLVPPGVDVDQFDWEEDPGGPPVVLYLGTLAPGLGARILLRAMAEVCQRVNARVVFAGPVQRDLRDSMLEGIVNLRLRDKVRLLGEVEHRDVAALIARATVCVCPAAVELSPRPTALYPTRILEFMACRRAVIAPRRGTVSLLMEEGTHGLLFTPGDPMDLARQIIALLGDPALRMQLASNGYQLVRQRHTASGARRSLRAAYAALAAAAGWTERMSRRAPTPDGVPAAPVNEFTEALDVDDLHEHTQEQPRLPVHDLTAVDVGSAQGELDDADRTAKWIDEGTEPHVRADGWEIYEPPKAHPAGGPLVGEIYEPPKAHPAGGPLVGEIHEPPKAHPAGPRVGEVHQPRKARPAGGPPVGEIYEPPEAHPAAGPPVVGVATGALADGEPGPREALERTGATAVLGDEEGTPLDVHAAPPVTPPLESRFAAGELEVSTPSPEELERPFTAVSVLLGGTSGDNTPKPND